MENKDTDPVYDAFMECFKGMGHPQSIYSDDEGSFSSNIQKYCKDEGITHKITLTHANVAERTIRTLKKMISDRLQDNKAGAWTIMLKPVLDKYNNKMVHSTTGLTPNEAHKDENSIEVKANSVLKEKYFRKYPNIKAGDDVRVFVKGKGNYTSRKESRSQWSEKIYKVISVKRDPQMNKYYVIDGLSKKYMRHELLLVNK